MVKINGAFPFTRMSRICMGMAQARSGELMSLPGALAVAEHTPGFFQTHYIFTGQLVNNFPQDFITSRFPELEMKLSSVR